MKNVLSYKFLFLALIGIGLTVNVAAQKVSETYAGIEDIEINLAMGDLMIKKSNTDKVSVEGTYDEDVVEVTIHNRGGRLVIKEEGRKNNNKDSNKSKWILMIPNGLNVQTNAGMGDIKIAGVQLDLQGNCGMGEIDLKKVEGKIKLNTGMGNIYITDSKGKFDLNTGMNDIEITDSEGKFKANTGMGNIDFEGGKITDKTSLNSGMGNVKMILAADPNGNISLSSGMGNAVLDYDGNEINGDFEMKCGIKQGRISAPFEFTYSRQVGEKNNGHIEKGATIGDGRYSITISTGNGNAKVKS